MTIEKRGCAMGSCEAKATGSGRCVRHTRILRLHGVTEVAPARANRCQVEGCDEGLFSKRYCLAHEVRCLRLRERHENQLARTSAVKAALFLAGRALNARRPRLVNDHGEIHDVQPRRHAG